MINQANNAEDEILLRKRLDNWKRTVRYLGGGRGNACAFWAELYLKSRVNEEEANKPMQPLRVPVTVEELDGWLVEAAWKALMDFDEKQALKFRFVYGYSDHWITRKLGLQRMTVPHLLARARKSLKNNLDKFEDPTTIHINNLRANVAGL
jgi:DNA-directed RNA polymerase specialized sigma24 family protein